MFFHYCVAMDSQERLDQCWRSIHTRVLSAGGHCAAYSLPTFAARMEDRHFVESFMKGGRPGVYCRVIAPGQVGAGESLELVPFPARSSRWTNTWPTGSAGLSQPMTCAVTCPRHCTRSRAPNGHPCSSFKLRQKIADVPSRAA